MRRFQSRRHEGGYILLELILASILFTVAVVGLARSAQMGTHSLALLNRENDIRLALRSFLEEVRRKPVAEMDMTTPDERLGVTFHSSLEELSKTNVNGTVLRDLYVLKVAAINNDGTEQEADSLEVWVYKPRTEQRQ